MDNLVHTYCFLFFFVTAKGCKSGYWKTVTNFIRNLLRKKNSNKFYEGFIKEKVVTNFIGDLLRKKTVTFYKEFINKKKVGGETGTKKISGKKFPKK